MIEILKLLGKHKGKAAGGSLALVLYLFTRGCDLQFGGLQFHAEPMKLHARTNATPAAVTNSPTLNGAPKDW